MQQPGSLPLPASFHRQIEYHVNAIVTRGIECLMRLFIIKPPELPLPHDPCLLAARHVAAGSYPKLQRVEGETKANRRVFTEAELQAIFATATAFELALFGTLSMTGPRPGDIYALDWSAVYLDVEKPYFRIERTWCS